MERYLAQVQNLSYQFITLLAEAFSLPSNTLSHFYDSDDLMQHRGKVSVYPLGLDTLLDFAYFPLHIVKIVKYPVLEDSFSDQGVGPHYDAGFLTFVRLPFHYFLHAPFIYCYCNRMPD